LLDELEQRLGFMAAPIELIEVATKHPVVVYAGFVEVFLTCPF
jgi:hypothetical protein